MARQRFYALDFDGVICDSAIETAMTGWKAGTQIWSDMKGIVPARIVDQFKAVRPAIETGYEAILAVRLLYLGHDVESLYANYTGLTQQLMADSLVSIETLKQLFGETRDQWIREDIAEWIAMNPLFDGIPEKLRLLSNQTDAWCIITTKQERFVKHILESNGVALADQRIFGLDRNLSKVEVLTNLQSELPDADFVFVEDRLPTLINVAAKEHLKSVNLVFALWGYNTDADKQSAVQQGFCCQHLTEFLLIDGL